MAPLAALVLLTLVRRASLEQASDGSRLMAPLAAQELHLGYEQALLQTLLRVTSAQF